MRTFITGVGTSNFGRQTDVGFEALAAAAVAEALDDAGLSRDDIDAVYVGTVFAPAGTASRVLRACGLAGIPALSIETACASGTTALHMADTAVRAGSHRNVLALGYELMTALFSGPITPEETDPEGRAGLAMPAMYALMAARYLHEYQRTPSDLAAVAVKNRRHGLLNPRVSYGGDYTVDDVLASRPVADPLTLLQCCPQADGAAAAIVSSAPAVPARAVEIRATTMMSGEAWGSGSGLWSVDTVARAAQQVYESAGVGPGDIDVFEVHDAFTIGELLTIESLGLAQPGAGADLVQSGHTALGGRQPVNPSGGLLARGHPLGATGLAQTAEIVWQLRGDADGRQVLDARCGLIETMGGGAAGVDGNACVLAVLSA